MSQNSKKRRDAKRKRKGLKGRAGRNPNQTDPYLQKLLDIGYIDPNRTIEVMGMGDGKVSIGRFAF